jgi:Flp pilus assembly protein TadG
VARFKLAVLSDIKYMMLNSRRKPANTESGQAALMVTLATPFLLGLLGVTVDVGYGYYVKQVAQAAVDSAAMAGAIMAQASGGTCSDTVLCQTNTVCPANPISPPVTTFDDACLYAKANGFPSTGNQRVIVSAGTDVPPSNSGVSANYWMTVVATQTLPLGFTRALGFNAATVSAQGTSGVIPSKAAGGCIWVLDPIANSAFNEGGSGNVQANCRLFVNSSGSSAMNVQGSATLNDLASKVVGGVVLSNNSNVTPTPITGATSVDDPFANLPAPNFSGCDYTNLQPHGTMTLSPGVYCGGLKISAGSTITFNPGTYVLNGGGLMVSSSNLTINGAGVTFYNTSNGYSFGSIVITGGATVNLSAPTSGTYKGVLFYQDRGIVTSANNAIGGGANQSYTGSIYMPSAALSYVGGSVTHALTTVLIAKTITISGNAFLAKDDTGELTGIPQTMVGLIQ